MTSSLSPKPVARRLAISLTGMAVAFSGLLAVVSGAPAMAVDSGHPVLCNAGKHIGCTGTHGAGSDVVLRTKPSNQDTYSFDTIDHVSNGTNSHPFNVGSGLNTQFNKDPIIILTVKNLTGCYVWRVTAPLNFDASLQDATTCDGSLPGSKWVWVNSADSNGPWRFVNIRATDDQSNRDSKTAYYMEWTRASKPVKLHFGQDGDFTDFVKDTT